MSTNIISVKQLVEEYKQLSAQEAVSFKLQANPPERLTASKVGGCPYWDFSQPLPTDTEGKTMYLLAQINFEDYPFPAPLPSKGLLQFFISGDDVYGLDYESPTEQKGFRVIYHPTVDSRITAQQVLEAGYRYSPEGGYDEESEDTFPVNTPQGHSITFGPSLSYPNIREEGHLHLSALVEKYALNEEQEEGLKDATSDLFYNTCSGWHLLGYPYFTQYDPRIEYDPQAIDNSNMKYDTLLFQLDSDRIEGKDEYAVLWGDCGVGNFFIPRDKLEALDFSDVLYNWDCC